MSWVSRTKQSRGDLVYLVRGKDAGRQAWYYVLVDRPKLSGFLARMKGGSLNLTQYGEVLYSGWGSTPPQSVVDKIKDDYS